VSGLVQSTWLAGSMAAATRWEGSRPQRIHTAQLKRTSFTGARRAAVSSNDAMPSTLKLE
jgi:hypothetical protein